MGYLARDRARRTYRPTARVAVIGLRVQPDLFRRDALFSLMDDLHESTGAVAVLSLIQGCQLHHVHVVGSDMPIRHCRSNSPLHSPLGQVLISTFDPGQIPGLVHRLNSESDEANVVRLSDFTKTIEQVRARGAAVGPAGESWPGTMVSVRLPTPTGDALALGLVASSVDPADDVEINKLLRALRGAINRRIGPTAVERVEAVAMSQAG
jgi:DNA-binding IclR family transcriptional regulator